MWDFHSKESQGNINSLVSSDALCNSASEAENQLDSGIFFPMDEKQCNKPDTVLSHEKCNVLQLCRMQPEFDGVKILGVFSSIPL